jgi:hypothetical protein
MDEMKKHVIRSSNAFFPDLTGTCCIGNNESRHREMFPSIKHEMSTNG